MHFLWPQMLWLLLAVLMVAVVALLARLRHASVAARGVGDITVHLARAGQPLAHLKAPDGTGTRFLFTIHDAQGFAPRLDNVFGNVAHSYVVTRNRHGQVQVRTPDGTTHTLVSPRTPLQVEGGLTLTYSDAATPEGAGGGPGPYGPGGRRRHDPYEGAADPYAGRSSSEAPTVDPYTGQPFAGSRRSDGNSSDAGPTKPRRRFADSDATTVTPGADPRRRSGAEDETHQLGGRPSLTKGGPDQGGTDPSRSSPRPPRGRARNDDLLN